MPIIMDKAQRREQIIDLWQTCFADPEPFVELYFSRVYRDENTLTIERDGRVLAALQLLPYTLNYFGTELPMTYVAGVCTVPEERRRGLMRQLLRESVEEMQRRGIALATLIPANDGLFDYYRRHGYTEAFDFTEETYDYPDAPIRPAGLLFERAIHPEIDQELFAYYDRQLRQRPISVLHTYEDYVTLLADHQMEDGNVYTARREEDGQPVGMVFTLPNDVPNLADNDIYISELLFDTNEICHYLLQETLIRDQALRARIRRPPLPNDCHRKGMAQVIDRERMISLWLAAHPERSLTREALEGLPAEELARRLMDYPERTAYMNQMLD